MGLLRMGILLAVACAVPAQNGNPELKIPPLKTSVPLEGHPVGVTAWGTIRPAPSGISHLAITVDLGELQENLTPVLAAQLNRSDRCGERLSLERAELVPAAPSGILTAHVHYERFACVKAFGKEVVKRLVGGNGVVEVALTPTVDENRIALAAEVRKIEADGSLGEVLRSGAAGDSLRQKIAASVESAVRKSATLQSALPAQVESAAHLQSARFADGGAGRLWVALAGELRLSPEQFRVLAKELQR